MENLLYVHFQFNVCMVCNRKPIKVDDLGLPPCVTNRHTEEWLVVWNMFFFPQKQAVANTVTLPSDVIHFSEG